MQLFAYAWLDFFSNFRWFRTSGLGNSTTHSSMGLPMSNLITITPTVLPISPPNVDNLCLRLSSKASLGCVKLTKLAVRNGEARIKPVV